MHAIRITLETLRLCAIQPTSWLTFALLAASGPVLSALAPLGITSESPTNSALLYELAIVSVALGSARGLAVLESVSSSIAHVIPRPTGATCALALVSVGLLHALFALAPAIGMGGFHASAPVLPFFLRLAVVLLVTAGVGGLLLRLALPVGSAPWILGVGLLLTPVLLPHPLPVRSLVLLAAALFWAARLLDHPPGRTA
jgi:hypothetical protein